MPHRQFPEEVLKAGRLLEKQGKVGETLFSEGTYQIQVGSFWPFLQMDDQGVLKDHFCTCQKGSDGAWCPHQAAAWLSIFKGLEAPLHVRFRHSLWNELCQMASRRHGYEMSCLKGSLASGFSSLSTTKIQLFSIKALNAKGREFLKSA